MGDAEYYNAEKLEIRISRCKIFNFILIVIRLMMAICTLGICGWIRFDLDFRDWVWNIDWYTYWYCMYVIMFAMIIEVMLSLTAVYALLYERTGLMTLTTWSMIIMFFWEMTGAIVIILYGMEESPVLIKQLDEVFTKLVYEWDVNPRASRVMRQIMEYVGCCGSTGSEDFIMASKPVPFECRSLITGNEYRYGCKQQFAWWLEPWTSYLAAVCFFFMITDIVGAFTYSRLKRSLYVYFRNEDY